MFFVVVVFYDTVAADFRLFISQTCLSVRFNLVLSHPCILDLSFNEQSLLHALYASFTETEIYPRLQPC